MQILSFEWSCDCGAKNSDVYAESVFPIRCNECHKEYPMNEVFEGCIFHPVYATGKGMPEVKGYVEMETGIVYWQQLDDPNWLYMGHVKMPITNFQWMVHDFVHGLMMGYPFLDVVKYVAHLTQRPPDAGTGSDLPE